MAGRQRKRNVLLLRIGYWSGAVLDGLMVIPMLLPAIGGRLFGIDRFRPGTDYRYAMMVAASLMLGWTVLLIWADRRPVERKGVLLITAIPVVAGLMLAGLYGVATGLVKAGSMALTWMIQCMLLALFLWAYFSAP